MNNPVFTSGTNTFANFTVGGLTGKNTYDGIPLVLGLSGELCVRAALVSGTAVTINGGTITSVGSAAVYSYDTYSGSAGQILENNYSDINLSSIAGSEATQTVTNRGGPGGIFALNGTLNSGAGADTFDLIIEIEQGVGNWVTWITVFTGLTFPQVVLQPYYPGLASNNILPGKFRMRLTNLAGGGGSDDVTLIGTFHAIK